MTFPSWRSIVAMVILWTVVLIGADLILDPGPAIWSGRSGDSEAAREDGDAEVRIWLRHPCGNPCLPAAADALRPVTWLGELKLIPYKQVLEELTLEEQRDAYEVESVLTVNRLEAVVSSGGVVDFQQVVAALSGIGLIPDRIDYRGVGHYSVDVEFDALNQLAARDPGIDLGLALGNAATGFDHLVTEYRGRGYYGWYDSTVVVPATEGRPPTLRFYPRLGATVDVMEVVEGLARVGLVPSAITIGTEAPR